jgi:DNA (cytosine-5)-methyltransferase 1
MGFTAVDLFCGAGGLSVGLQRTGFEVILANEIEPDFARTYELNHPGTVVIVDDIKKINFREQIRFVRKEKSKISLLSGGPPCQGFSTVGSKKENDPRNSLFYQYLRAVDELRPSYILFENVSGFAKLYEGKPLQTLLKELAKLDYKVSWSVLEASDFGLPQNRQRTILVGWQSKLPKVNLPSPKNSNEPHLFTSATKIHLMEAISDLPPLGINDSKDKYASPPMNDFQRLLRNGAKLLTEHNSSKYGEKMQKILSLVPAGGTVEDLPISLRPKSYFKNTYARLLPNVPAPTITRNFGTPSSSRCIHPFQNRALSTREGARLQGFPDSYLFFGSKCSKNLQIGNAVPPLFGEVIGREIYKALTS